MKNGDLRGDRIYPLKGYLYDLARYRDKCLGIFQTDNDSKLELLKVSRDGETHLKCIDKPDSPIQSHSGISVKPRSTHRTFYTSGEKLSALDTSKYISNIFDHLTFQRHRPSLKKYHEEKDAYMLYVHVPIENKRV